MAGKTQRELTEFPVGFMPIEPKDEVHIRESDVWKLITKVGANGNWVFFEVVHYNHKHKGYRVPTPIHISMIDKVRRMI